MEFSGSIYFCYTGLTKRSEIVERARADWRSFTENPEAELPWNTSIDVSPGDAVRYPDGAVSRSVPEATVTIRWERAT